MTEIPTEAKSILDTYVAALRDTLPDLVSGVFIHGSIALGAYHPHSSDLDLVTLVSRPLTPDDCIVLEAIHKRLKTQYPRPALEVSYLQSNDLGKFEDKIAPHPCYHDGLFTASGYHDENSITWWLLKQRGIALYGEIPDFPVDWNQLVRHTHENLNSYWIRFTRDPTRIAWLTSDYGVQWAVLGVLRQYYTFVEDDITSKDGAGHYGLEHLPPRWHRLLHESLAIRQQAETPLKSEYASRFLRAFEAWQFMRMIIALSNARFEARSA